MNKPIFVLLACLMLTIFPVVGAFATSYTYNPVVIDLSGYSLQAVSDINNSGQIVGGLWSAADTRAYGFLMSGSTPQLLFPNNPSSANGINNNGAIVGNYEAYYTYNYIKAGTTPYTFTGYFPGTPTDVNNSNVIACSTADSRGFYLPFNIVTGPDGSDTDGTTYLNLDGAVRDAAFGINDNGQIVGSYLGSDGKFLGYIYNINDKTFITFSVPGAASTTATNINNNGDVVGTFWYSNDPIGYGFVRHPDGTFDIIRAFGSDITEVNGINDYGIIVGSYRDNAGGLQAFTASPVPLPCSLFLLGTGLLGLSAVGWRRRKVS